MLRQCVPGRTDQGHGQLSRRSVVTNLDGIRRRACFSQVELEPIQVTCLMQTETVDASDGFDIPDFVRALPRIAAAPLFSRIRCVYQFEVEVVEGGFAVRRGHLEPVRCIGPEIAQGQDVAFTGCFRLERVRGRKQRHQHIVFVRPTVEDDTVVGMDIGQPELVPVDILWAIHAEPGETDRLVDRQRCQLIGRPSGVVARCQIAALLVRLVDENGATGLDLHPVVTLAGVDPYRLEHRRADGDPVIAIQCVDDDGHEVALGRQRDALRQLAGFLHTAIGHGLAASLQID